MASFAGKMVTKGLDRAVNVAVDKAKEVSPTVALQEYELTSSERLGARTAKDERHAR
jgi:hypothetical protein